MYIAKVAVMWYAFSRDRHFSLDFLKYELYLQKLGDGKKIALCHPFLP